MRVEGTAKDVILRVSGLIVKMLVLIEFRL